MVELIYGFNTIFFNIIVAVIILIYAYLMFPIIKRGFKENIKQKWNNAISLFLLIIVSIMLILPEPDGDFILAYPVNYYIIFFTGAWCLVTVISTKIGKERDEYKYNKVLLSGIEQAASGGATLEIHNFGYERELHRKMVHVMSSLYLLGILLPTVALPLVFKYGYAINPGLFSWEEYYNSFLMGSTSGAVVETSFIGLFLALIGSFVVQMNGEIMRLRMPNKPFILKHTLQKTRRATEARTFGAHVSIVIGFMIAAIILGYSPAWRYQGLNAMVAVILVSALADMIAALIGRRWGKIKWKINKDKSYIGSIAGSLIAFFGSVFFVGWLLAIVTVGVFIFTDIVLAKINLSDNLTTPIILAIIFRIMISFVHPLLPFNWFALSL